MNKPIVLTKHFGRIYKAVVFTDVDEANSFMESNKDYGLLKIKDGKFYLARLDDKGEIDE